MTRPPACRTACLACDLIVDLGTLEEGQRARCPSCGHLLAARFPNAFDRSLALALAAAIFLVLANGFPFLALESNGIEQVMTLPGSAVELYEEGDAAIAVLVLGPIVGVPGLMIATLLYLLIAVRRRRKAAWLVPAGRLLFALGPWSMVEVFLIGVLVSLIKIGTLAHVVLGVSFWSYVAFAIAFTATIASLDRFQIWEQIEACGR